MYFSDREGVLNDLKNKKPETTFLYATPDQASFAKFKIFLQSLHQDNKLAYFVVDEGKLSEMSSHPYTSILLKFDI